MVLSQLLTSIQLMQAVRRLYSPKGKKLPLPLVVELNRRLVKGYTRYKDDPRIVSLKRAVLAYNKRLMMLNVRDHQVEYAKYSVFHTICALIYRLGKLAILSIIVIPGTILFSPVFITGKVFSIKKSREALAASTVKIQARDVMATWKLLTAIVVAPLTYFFWIALFTYFRGFGYVPTWMPSSVLIIAQIIVYPTITYGSLRFGEIGMDIAKSLPPLIYLLVPSSSNTLTKLRKTRTDLANQVTDVINTLGPEMFDDFHSKRIITDVFGNDVTPPISPTDSRQSEFTILDSPISSSEEVQHRRDSIGSSSALGNLPRNESFKDLGRAEFYSTRPATPTKPRSRQNSFGGGLGGGFGLTPMSPMRTVDGEGGMAEVSEKLRKGLRERGMRRRSSAADGWELGSGSRSGATTPGSEGGRKDM